MPGQNLTGKTPASTYQSLLQKRGTDTFVDGLGNTFIKLSDATVASSNYSISASYSPINPQFSSSISSVKQNTLVTGDLYPITSSWATNWNSASVITLIGTKQNTLGTGSNYPITSSWAVNWNSSSIVTLIGTKQNTLGTGSTYPITSSWAENATLAQNVVSGALVESASYVITASYALTSSYISQSSVRIENGELYLRDIADNSWHHIYMWSGSMAIDPV